MCTLASRWNHRILSIAFIGNYVCDLPTRVAINSLFSFLEYMVNQTVISANYTLYGHCQTRAVFPDSPGAALMMQIRTWEHWVRQFCGFVFAGFSFERNLTKTNK